VQDRMNRRLVRVAPTDTIEYTLRRMEAHAVRQLLVYGGDRLVGMLGDREIQRLAGPQAAGSAPETVEDVMRRDVDAISPCAPLAEAATRMLDHGVDALPVVDDGSVVGIISDRELLEAAAGRPAVSAAPVATGDDRGGRRSATEKLRRYHHVAVLGLLSDTATKEHIDTAKLMSLGVTVYPVHPTEIALLGVRCYRSLIDIPRPVDIVQVFPREGVDLRQSATEAIETAAKIFWVEGVEVPEDISALLDAEHIDVAVGRSLYRVLEAQMMNASGRLATR
jgi:CBS domain-containing protein/predicted CoA-binding protein